MKSVAATSGNGIIEIDLQIVVAQEPVEGRPGFFAPAVVARCAVGLQTCRNCTRSLDRLLIEARLFATLTIESLRPDRHEMPVALRTLSFREPLQRFQAGGNH